MHSIDAVLTHRVLCIPSCADPHLAASSTGRTWTSGQSNTEVVSHPCAIHLIRIHKSDPPFPYFDPSNCQELPPQQELELAEDPDHGASGGIDYPLKVRPSVRWLWENEME